MNMERWRDLDSCGWSICFRWRQLHKTVVEENQNLQFESTR